MIKDSFLCFYNDFIADTSSPVHAAMLTEGASCQETSCSDLYINRNIARAALTAVWRYRLFLEAGRRVPACDSHSCCGVGRVMPVCDFHSCCEEGRGVHACDSLSVWNSRACGGRHGWIAREVVVHPVCLHEPEAAGFSHERFILSESESARPTSQGLPGSICRRCSLCVAVRLSPCRSRPCI